MAIEGTLGPSPRMVLNESNANEWSAMNEGEQISYLRHWPAVRQPHTTTRRMATTIRRQNKRFQAEKFFLPWFSFCFILLKKRERELKQWVIVLERKFHSNGVTCVFHACPEPPGSASRVVVAVLASIYRLTDTAEAGCSASCSGHRWALSRHASIGYSALKTLDIR